MGGSYVISLTDQLDCSPFTEYRKDAKKRVLLCWGGSREYGFYFSPFEYEKTVRHLRGSVGCSDR